MAWFSRPSRALGAGVRVHLVAISNLIKAPEGFIFGVMFRVVTELYLFMDHGSQNSVALATEKQHAPTRTQNVLECDFQNGMYKGDTIHQEQICPPPPNDAPTRNLRGMKAYASC